MAVRDLRVALMTRRVRRLCNYSSPHTALLHTSSSIMAHWHFTMAFTLSNQPDTLRRVLASYLYGILHERAGRSLI